MATVTRRLVSFDNGQGTCALDLVYDDVTFRVIRIERSSTLAGMVECELTRESDGHAYSARGAGNGSTVLPVTGGNRLFVTVTPEGALRGFGFSAGNPEA